MTRNEWVRITCTPAHDPKREVFMGVVWGMAGELDEVKASFSLTSELERYRKPPPAELGLRGSRSIGFR